MTSARVESEFKVITSQTVPNCLTIRESRKHFCAARHARI